MRARLTIETGEGTPAVCELDPDRPVTLGRNRRNTIVIEDEHASRFHAEIFHRDSSWLIRDCETLNGTRLNGERIHQPRPLAAGAEIVIGGTRLRFVTDGATSGTPAAAFLDHHLGKTQPISDAADSCPTPLRQDELTVLCSFMAASVEEPSPRVLVKRALEAVQKQTTATVVGFLSLDENEPLPKMVLPELAQVDVHLSRQLTQKVQSEGRTVWLGALRGDAQHSDSLLPFRDALCVPLRAEGAALGALHVYKTGEIFSEREARFCEVLGGYLANSLYVLRSRRNLAAENLRLRVHAPAAADEELLGDSLAMQQVRQQIARVAPHAKTVLVVGESGVGKELVALALHRQSTRREGPLVVVNCAAIAGNLAEAELFGQCQGAFTGAVRDRPGFFQQADEGSLFLDELGELTSECQAKLLRVMEGKSFRPVGATADVHADVRIIAATNRDLEREVAAGRFRKDLFFRLGIPIRVPPLCEHCADIPILVNHFLGKLSISYHRSARLTEGALRRLQEYSWPGNVRQLWSVVEYAVAMTEDDKIDVKDLHLPAEQPSGEDAEDLNLDLLEARAIRLALRRTEGSLARACKLLGLHRDTLTAKMKKYGIDKKEA